MAILIEDPKNNYDPRLKRPFSSFERIFFNLSVVYITLVSALFFAFLMSTVPSLFSFVVGMIWAIPGFIILYGYRKGKEKRSLRPLKRCVYIAEIIFTVYICYLCYVARTDPVAVGADIALLVMYLCCTRFGIVQLIREHKVAYYDSSLKR